MAMTTTEIKTLYPLPVYNYKVEIDGVANDIALESLRLGAAKLPIKTRFIQRIAE